MMLYNTLESEEYLKVFPYFRSEKAYPRISTNVKK